MTKLTKEEQIQAIYDLKVGYTLGHADIAMLKAIARQMLSGMEQEPVACIDRANMDYLESGAGADVWPASEVDSDDVLLYAAPQLPQPAVVPPEYATPARADNEWQNGYCIGWNACRAAMLQGTETVQGWIPCSERMPEEVGRYWCYVEEQNSLGKSHYQWNCSWNGELWGGEMMYGRVTHWMPLQEPPKQTSES